MSSTKMSRQQVMEEQLSCPLCLDQFMDPLVLDCLHSYCLGCLEQYANQLGVGQGQPLMCPVCRASSIVPPGGVGNFRSNFFVKGLVEAMGHVTLGDPDEEEDESCDMCDVGGGSNVEAECLTCPGKMCSQCTHAHKTMKLFKDHDIIITQATPRVTTPAGSTSNQDQHRSVQGNSAPAPNTEEDIDQLKAEMKGTGNGDPEGGDAEACGQVCPLCHPALLQHHRGHGHHHRRHWRWHRRLHGHHPPPLDGPPHGPPHHHPPPPPEGESTDHPPPPPHCDWFWHRRGRRGHRGPRHHGLDGENGGGHGRCRGRWGRGRMRRFFDGLQKNE